MSGTRPYPAHMYRVPDPSDTRVADLTSRVAQLEDENAKLKKRIEILEPPKQGDENDRRARAAGRAEARNAIEAFPRFKNRLKRRRA